MLMRLAKVKAFVPYIIKGVLTAAGPVAVVEVKVAFSYEYAVFL